MAAISSRPDVRGGDACSLAASFHARLYVGHEIHGTVAAISFGSGWHSHRLTWQLPRDMRGPYLGRRGFYTWWWSRVVQRRAAAGTKTPSPRRRLQPRTKTHGTESRQAALVAKTLIVAELVFYWDDNNRFKPMTTVTTLATRGAALYIGGRRSVNIRRARRGCRRVCRRGAPLSLASIRPAHTLSACPLCSSRCAA